MPFYTWHGITIDGNNCKGYLFAVSPESLDERLFAQGIALISCVNRQPYFSRSVTDETIINFFHELSVLLNAAVLLPDALVILGSQFPQPKLQEIIDTIALRVADGVPLYEIMKNFPHFFSLFMIQMVRIGYESGRLAHSIKLLSDHLQTQHCLKKKMKASLIGPASILIFFLLIAFILFFFIVPHFASLLETTDKPLPITTQCMLSISLFISSIAFPITVLGVLLVLLVVRRWCITQGGKRFLSALILRVPFFGSLVRDHLVANCFNSLHLLLSGGVHLVEALGIVSDSMSTTYIAHHISVLKHRVQSGSCLSQALYLADLYIFDPEIISLIAVAQESGCMAQMAGQAGRLYSNRIMRKLSLLSVLIQPLILVILGILVSLLVFSVYIPLFSMVETVVF